MKGRFVAHSAGELGERRSCGAVFARIRLRRSVALPIGREVIDSPYNGGPVRCGGLDPSQMKRVLGNLFGEGAMNSGVSPNGSQEVFDAELAGQSPPPPRRSAAGMIIIGLFIGIALFPVLYVWAPDEIARWYQAAAEEQRLDGNLKEAIESIGHSIDRFPDNEELLLKRAEWLNDDGEYEQALADCERALDLAPDLNGFRLRSMILQNLGQFDEAIQDSLAMLKLTETMDSRYRPEMLNWVAYSRALANKDLDQALQEIEESLKLRAPVAATLDTRGFIHYLRGEYDKARSDLDRAVEEIEAQLASANRQFDGESGVFDPRVSKLNQEQLQKSVAVLRYHRSLVFDALGDESLAEEDRQRVVTLGHEPDNRLF